MPVAWLPHPALVPPWVRRHRVFETILGSFVIKSLEDFATGLDQDFLLLPVPMLREYPNRIASFIIRSRSVFICIVCYYYICIYMYISVVASCLRYIYLCEF